MKTLKLNVKGMHCHSCGMIIKDSLEEADGIKNAYVSHETGTVSVTYDEKLIDEKKIKDIIRKEGYKV